METDRKIDLPIMGMKTSIEYRILIRKDMLIGTVQCAENSQNVNQTTFSDREI